MNKERIREKTLIDIKKAKQTTFENLPKNVDKPSEAKPNKSITIQLNYTTKDDELDLSIGFHLLPSKIYFSNLILDLSFDNNKLNTYLVNIPPSRLLSDELEFPLTLDMTGIQAGEHIIKVEMSEKGETGEIIVHASKYIVLQYSPIHKHDRYVKVPIVRKIDGTFKIVLPEEKELYRVLEKEYQKELNSKKDRW
jgi:hypothetical protein